MNKIFVIGSSSTDMVVKFSKLNNPNNLYTILLTVVIVFATGYRTFGQSEQPLYTYLQSFSFKDTSGMKLSGLARVINFEGRRGVNLTSIKSVLELKATGTENSPPAFWFMQRMIKL